MIEIKNLDFSYKKTPVFSNINLSFPQGAIYGLLGENGVGKTTLLKIICGLQRPNEGSCTVDGMTSHDRLPAMLQRIVFLPDEVTLPDNATPQKYVDELSPFYSTFSQGTFLHLMQELEVEPDRKFREMSFGQQKKSLIAASLSLGTDYVLLDEPTNGLDIPSKAQFRSILSKIADEGKTIIISTHQVRDVELLLDHLCIIEPNRVLLDASMATVSDRLRFLDVTPGQAPAEVIYSEQSLQGYSVIAPRHEDEEETPVNLELLFNGLLSNAEGIQREVKR